MYNGWDDPAPNVLMPRSCTLKPPPGAPELLRILTPAILPDKALSTVGDETVPVNYSEFTVETALAKFERCTDEASPVTTTSSRFATLFCNSMVISLLSVVTSTFF